MEIIWPLVIHRCFWSDNLKNSNSTLYFSSLITKVFYLTEKQLNSSFNCELSNTCRPPLREWVGNISNHFHAILRPFGLVEKNAFLSDGVYCHKLGCNIILLKKYLGSSLRQQYFVRLNIQKQFKLVNEWKKEKVKHSGWSNKGAFNNYVEQKRWLVVMWKKSRYYEKCPQIWIFAPIQQGFFRYHVLLNHLFVPTYIVLNAPLG